MLAQPHEKESGMRPAAPSGDRVLDDELVDLVELRVFPIIEEAVGPRRRHPSDRKETACDGRRSNDKH